MKNRYLALSFTAALFASALASCTLGEGFDDSTESDTTTESDDDTSTDSSTDGTPVPPDDQSDESAYLDTDGDGRVDSIEADGDGLADYFLGNLDIDPSALCTDPLVDSDGDGQIDGIDLDCDGVIDISLDIPGGGPGVSQCSTSVNGNSIDCRSEDGSPYSCECSVNGTVVSTCTTDSDNACTQPGGNCCGF